MLSCNYINEDLRITVGELYRSLGNMIKNGSLDRTSKILWVSQVNKNDDYEKEYNAIPGSLLFGLEWLEDGEVQNGTLKLEPSLITSQIN